jgi:hypothetical protein
MGNFGKKLNTFGHTISDTITDTITSVAGQGQQEQPQIGKDITGL